MITVRNLTIVGTAIDISGNFRPNFDVIYPKMMLPINPPTHSKLAIHEASSIVIGPDGNGDSSDVRIRILGDDHPDVTP